MLVCNKLRAFLEGRLKTFMEFKSILVFFKKNINKRYLITPTHINAYGEKIYRLLRKPTPKQTFAYMKKMNQILKPVSQQMTPELLELLEKENIPWVRAYKSDPNLSDVLYIASNYGVLFNDILSRIVDPKVALYVIRLGWERITVMNVWSNDIVDCITYSVAALDNYMVDGKSVLSIIPEMYHTRERVEMWILMSPENIIYVRPMTEALLWKLLCHEKGMYVAIRDEYTRLRLTSTMWSYIARINPGLLHARSDATVRLNVQLFSS
jgi:hypothetical protein